jgi:hypothetical protein
MIFSCVYDLSEGVPTIASRHSSISLKIINLVLR